MKRGIQKTTCIALAIILIVSVISITAFASNPKSAPIPNGVYHIGTVCGNRVDIRGADTTNGAVAQVWEKADVDNQAFILTRLPDDSYRIVAYHSELALEVSNSSCADCGRVQQWEFLDNYDCKRWYIVECNKGWYKFINKNSGKCLDIQWGNDESGTVLQQYTDNGTDAQRFSLTKLDYSPQKYNRYSVGDVVYVDGMYYSSSNGSGKSGCRPNEYIIDRIMDDAKYPYAIRPINGKSIYGWVNESGISLPDYTYDIINGMLPEYEKLYVCFSEFSVPSAIDLFYKSFKHKGVFDIKYEENWNRLFKCPFPANNAKFRFLDMTITADQLGNILYGWVGSMLGINDTMLFWGGGFAHQLRLNTKLDKVEVLGLDCLYDPSLYYGDTAEDHFDIVRGIQLGDYRESYKIELRIDAEGDLINCIGTTWNYIKNLDNLLLLLSV